MVVLDVLGSLASIIGLWITVVVFRRLGRIERWYKQLGLLPQHTKRLRGLTGNLDKAIDRKDTDGMRQALGQCKEVLNAIHPLLSVKQASQASDLAQKIESLRNLNGAKFQVQCEAVLIELHVENEHLRLLHVGQIWSANDGR